MDKKRHVVSYENMSQELLAAFNEKYPRGYQDFFDDLVKYPKPDGTSFYAVTVEIPDAIYLVSATSPTALHGTSCCTSTPSSAGGCIRFRE